MVYIIYICIAVPLVLMLPLLQKQSRWLVGFMLLGATVAVSSAEINTVLQLLFGFYPYEVSLHIAPLTEEIMKAAPVLIYAVFASDDRKKVLPLAMAVGIGFAVLENTFILVNNIETVTVGWALVRGLSTSLTHGMCTFIVGCGIVHVKKQKKLFYTGTFGLLAVAVTFHATFNLLIGSQYKAAGIALPVIVYLAAQAVMYISRRKTAI